jgi:xanthine dehydrogenase accessory factor
MLLWVLDSKGSSPGRRGFRMAIASDDDFTGTIGGGIMEFKLVEKAKMLLQKKVTDVSLVHQHHDKSHGSNQSGMICSGSQVIAFIPLSNLYLELFKEIAQDDGKEIKQSIQISMQGIQLAEGNQSEFKYNNDEDWIYTESVHQQPVIHIIGGGHVSLALSELMHLLDFYIKVYDDRPGLNTFLRNRFAQDFVVIMTIGYRTDKIVLKQLLDDQLYYLGLLGSDKKIETLFAELKEEGVKEEALKKVFTPIGINIFSRTTQEIAVSIAAEIIREKNKVLPAGRNNQ